MWNEMLEHNPSAVLVDPDSGKALPLSIKRSPNYIKQVDRSFPVSSSFNDSFVMLSAFGRTTL